MKTLLVITLAATLVASHASADGITVSATAPGKPIVLGSKPVIASLIYRPVPRAAQLAHCYVVVSGLTASRPTQYEIKVVSQGAWMRRRTISRGRARSASTTPSGSPPAKTAPLSFEVPVLFAGTMPM